MGDFFPFMRLPIELRNSVYAEILSCPTPIHVRKPLESHRDHFVFCLHGHQLSREGVCNACYSSTTRTTYPDTALLHVTEQVRKEAFRVVLGANTLYFADRSDLDSFLDAFSPYTDALSSVIFATWINDEQLRNWELRKLRASVRAMKNLKRLEVHARVEPEGIELHLSGVLNFFRPLSRLPLSTAQVHLYPSVYSGTLGHIVTEAKTLRYLELRAVKKMLRDPSLPELPQVPRPGEHVEAMKRKRESEKPAKYVFNPGAVIARMGGSS